MDYLILVALFLGIFILPIYLAILDHRKKEKKITDIESKCSEIISISKEIIHDLNLDRTIKDEHTVGLYQEKNLEISPFLTKEVFARSGYTLFELNEKTPDHKNYFQLEEHGTIEYDLVTA